VSIDASDKIGVRRSFSFFNHLLIETLSFERAEGNLIAHCQRKLCLTTTRTAVSVSDSEPSIKGALRCATSG
jgi:hypothetical protein